MPGMTLEGSCSVCQRVSRALPVASLCGAGKQHSQSLHPTPTQVNEASLETSVAMAHPLLSFTALSWPMRTLVRPPKLSWRELSYYQMLLITLFQHQKKFD